MLVKFFFTFIFLTKVGKQVRIAEYRELEWCVVKLGGVASFECLSIQVYVTCCSVKHTDTTPHHTTPLNITKHYSVTLAVLSVLIVHWF